MIHAMACDSITFTRHHSLITRSLLPYSTFVFQFYANNILKYLVSIVDGHRNSLVYLIHLPHDSYKPRKHKRFRPCRFPH